MKQNETFRLRKSFSVKEESNGEVGPITAKKYADPTGYVVVNKVNNDPMVLGMGAIITFNWSSLEERNAHEKSVAEIFEYFGFTVEDWYLYPDPVIEGETFARYEIYMSYGKNPIAIDIQADDCTFNVRYLVHMLLKHYFSVATSDGKSCDQFDEYDLNVTIADILTKELDYSDDSEIKDDSIAVLIKALDLYKITAGHRNTSKVIMLSLLKELMDFR